MESIKDLLNDGGRTLTLGASLCILVYVGADRFVSQVERQIEKNARAVETLSLAHRDYLGFKEAVRTDLVRLEGDLKSHAGGAPHEGVRSALAVLESRVSDLKRELDRR